MNQEEQVAQTSRELARLRQHVEELRLLVLRVPALLAVALIAVGLFLPIGSEEVEDEQRTYRLVSIGFQALGDSGDDGTNVFLGVGFVGLLVVLVLLVLVLCSSVVARGGTERGAWVRTATGALAVIGSVIAALFSLVAAGSDESDVSGGPGAYLALAGAVLGVAVLSHRPWQELWIRS
jgi:hypothetical protein